MSKPCTNRFTITFCAPEAIANLPPIIMIIAFPSVQARYLPYGTPPTRLILGKTRFVDG